MELAVQRVIRAGLNPGYGAVSASDTFPFSLRTFLHVKNGSAGAINVTINAQRTCESGVDHDEVVAVPAGGERLIGGFTDRFVDSNGRVNVLFSAQAGVTAAVFEV